MRILIADDHRIVREGLKSLLDDQPDMEVVAEADNGRDAVQLVGEATPDVVVMDVGMPQLNGVEATRRVMRDYPGTKVVALSMHSDRRFTAEMLKAGAAGYLLKDSAFEELVTAIRAIAAGKVYLSPSVADLVVDDYVSRLPSAEGNAFVSLTTREREVLQLLAEGKATKEVARLLGVSIKTVETHRRQIMQKLDLHSVAELTKYAVREGITPLDK